jgi:hypothetical protein
MSLMSRSVRSPRRAGGLALLAVLTAPALALAQTAPAPPPPTVGDLTIETMESGFVIEPDVRLTEVDDAFGTLAGVQAGWLTDDRLLVGGAGYWLANGSADRKMAYGGLVVGWSLARSHRVGVTFGALVGGGTSTLGVEVLGYPHGRSSRHGGPVRDLGEPQTVLVRAREGFFIAEPRASASLLLTPWLRLGAGVSYRLLGGARGFEDRLRGVSGTVSVQIGAF